MNYFSNEDEARNAVVAIVKKCFPVGDITIVERNPINVATREAIFAVKVKKDDSKMIQLLNGLFASHVENPHGLKWVGTKMDFLLDKEHEYVLIRATVQNTL